MLEANHLPNWVRSLAQASADYSLQCDESEIPRDFLDALDPDLPWDRREIDLEARLKSCTPREAHYFLHWAWSMNSVPYDSLTSLFDIVIRRPDCDRATALNYFAWYWPNYHDGRDAGIGDEQHALMSYIRARAWGEGFEHRRLDVPEGVLHAHDEMRNVLVNDNHPFNMPASFFALGRKEELYFTIRDKLLASQTRLS